MKSVRVLFLLVVMSGISAMDNSDTIHINLDDRYFTGNCVDENGYSLLHLAALYLGSDKKIVVTFCPAALEGQAVNRGAEQLFSNESKIKEFGINNFVKLSRIKNTQGKTPLNILDERRCNTKLCMLLRKKLNLAATSNAIDAKLGDFMTDLER